MRRRRRKKKRRRRMVVQSNLTHVAAVVVGTCSVVFFDVLEGESSEGRVSLG